MLLNIFNKSRLDPHFEGAHGGQPVCAHQNPDLLRGCLLSEIAGFARDAQVQLHVHNSHHHWFMFGLVVWRRVLFHRF